MLYVYRVLLTGIHLMRAGVIETNLLALNEEFRLAFLKELIDRKPTGPERSRAEDADLVLHESESHAQARAPQGAAQRFGPGSYCGDPVIERSAPNLRSSGFR